MVRPWDSGFLFALDDFYYVGFALYLGMKALCPDKEHQHPSSGD